jgi:ATP-binding cassette subfamily F protein uup
MGDARGTVGRHYWPGGFRFGRQGDGVLALIGLRFIDKFYGGRAVLRALELSVVSGARIGLVGGNGAGKSTLLRLLAGLEEPDGGEVIRRRGLRVAYLPQYVERGGHSPMELLRAARPELAEVRRELEACEERLGAPEVTGDLRRMERVLERHGRLLERFPGTVVFVSHDRYFLDHISDTTVEVRDGEVFRYGGGYSDWRRSGTRF